MVGEPTFTLVYMVSLQFLWSFPNSLAIEFKIFVGISSPVCMKHSPLCGPKYVISTLNFLPWFPVFFCELGKGSINTVLLVKIEGRVWYTIYHHVPIVKGVSSNPSIHQPTNGKRTSMGSIHAVKLTRSPKGLIGQGDLGLPAANRSKSPRDNPNAPVIHHKPEP